jgi:hypothetical protein
MSLEKKLSLAEHPRKSYMWGFRDCAEKDCTDLNIIVEHCEVDIHPTSGDAYVNFAVRCSKCHRFDARSYAEN